MSILWHTFLLYHQPLRTNGVKIFISLIHAIKILVLFWQLGESTEVNTAQKELASYSLVTDKAKIFRGMYMHYSTYTCSDAVKSQRWRLWVLPCLLGLFSSQIPCQIFHFKFRSWGSIFEETSNSHSVCVREHFLTNAKKVIYGEKAFWLLKTLKQDIQSSACSFHLSAGSSASNRRKIRLCKICKSKKA